MDVQVLPLQADPSEATAAWVASIVGGARSLEEMFYTVINGYGQIRVQACALDPEKPTEETLNIEIQSKEDWKTKQSEHRALVVIPLEVVRKRYRFRPLLETVIPWSDSDGYTVDDGWFERRNKRLGIRLDETDGEVMVAPPGAMMELVLSYAVACGGMVSMKKELAEIRYSVPFVIGLELVFLNGTLANPVGPLLARHSTGKKGGGDREKLSGNGWVEKIVVPLNRLESLLRRRREREGAREKKPTP